MSFTTVLIAAFTLVACIAAATALMRLFEVKNGSPREPACGTNSTLSLDRLLPRLQIVSPFANSC